MFLLRLDDGRISLLGRIIRTRTAFIAEVYHNGQWNYWPPLTAYLDGSMPWLEEIEESEVPRYTKMVDDQSRG
ncbi:MAG: hypothetical protein ACOY0T_11340 [Myxococcota bacterium]